MRRASIITIIVLAMVMATASVAIAKGPKQGVEKQKIIRIFDSTYTAVDSPRSFGKAELVRRADGLDATVKVHGLMPGGVYTFWWVVGEAGFELPNAYVASAGGQVIGKNGKAKVSMSVDVGDPGILGFGDALGGGPPASTAPFHATFDLDPMTAQVHLEIAYHGQAADAGGDLAEWLSDFWTGTACPEGSPVHNPGGTTGAHAVFSNPGQPHCPVSYLANFPGS